MRKGLKSGSVLLTHGLYNWACQIEIKRVHQKVLQVLEMEEVEGVEIIAVAKQERGKRQEAERGAAEFFPFYFFHCPLVFPRLKLMLWLFTHPTSRHSQLLMPSWCLLLSCHVSSLSCCLPHSSIIYRQCEKLSPGKVKARNDFYCYLIFWPLFLSLWLYLILSFIFIFTNRIIFFSDRMK